MGPALLRIDDRLLHGQVALGWVAALGSKLIVIADDDTAADDWMARLYAGAAPPGVRLGVLTLEETAARFAEFSDESLAAIVLVKTPSAAVVLLEKGADVEAVNVGGMGFAPGRRRLLPYLYVGVEEEAALRRLLDLGVRVEAQDVPGGSRYDVESLLKSGGGG